MKKVHIGLVGPWIVCTIAIACSSGLPSSNGTGGTGAGNGGTATVGGTATGGAHNGGTAGSSGGSGNIAGTSTSVVVDGTGPTGGTSAATTSGAPSTGGAIPTGGSSSAEGNPSTGGNANTGGAPTTGGANATGGVNGTGGANATGGVMSTGGTVATGGAAATGGASAVSTGGSNLVSTGGTTLVATGGTKATGGTTSAITTGGTVSTGGAETGGSATAGCPGTGGSLMVMLPQGYCIDSTEVTQSQYAAWVATTPALPSSSDTNCWWKSTGSYAADATCMASGYVCQGTACGNQPQVCVDWCDAYSYCLGVGKRLCGRIGGGTNPYTEYANATMSQWYNACSSGGANTYPYAGAYQTTTCNGSDWGKDTTMVVGSLTGCQASSPYAGVYDLSGNATEWEDSCSGTGHSAFCRTRGGSFNNDNNYLACGTDYNYPQDVVSSEIGFRCCAP